MLALVLASAVVHAMWNVLLGRAPRGPDTTAVATALGLLAWTPLALVRWRIDGGVWPYVALSAAFQLAYFVTLTVAYAHAPPHATYPVARGLAPVLLLATGLVTGGRVPALAALAVGAISAGILLTAWGTVDRRALGYAVPVAASIAAYTLVDARGLHHADPAPYLWLCMLPVATTLVLARVVTGRGLRSVRAAVRPATIAVGIGVFGAYGLTLAALARATPAQVPAVAAVRETGILFVIGLSWLLDRAGTGGRRPTVVTAFGGVLVFGGVVVLAIS